MDLCEFKLFIIVFNRKYDLFLDIMVDFLVILDEEDYNKWGVWYKKNFLFDVLIGQEDEEDDQ